MAVFWSFAPISATTKSKNLKIHNQDFTIRNTAMPIHQPDYDYMVMSYFEKYNHFRSKQDKYAMDPGSQIYPSSVNISFGQKRFLNKKNA